MKKLFIKDVILGNIVFDMIWLRNIIVSIILSSLFHWPFYCSK